MTRFLLYSHDTYGLGHFRRSAQLAAGLAKANNDNEVLIVTGSPRAQAFSLGDRVDTVKLPTATKDEAGGYQPRKLRGTTTQLVRLRGNLVHAAATAYEPDVFVVDHAPLGMSGELTATLKLFEQSRRRPRMVLGLRDIIDDRQRVELAWRSDGTWESLEFYDDILVYGDPTIATTAMELGLDRHVSATVTHTGYVAPRMPDDRAADPFLLVTAGGGGDGHKLLRRVFEAVESGATSDLRCLIVLGPLLSSARRTELLLRAEALPTVEAVEFSDQMRSLIASATGVISMAGYNTVVEELAARTPSLLVPRSQPRLEQHIRATRLAPRTCLEHCPLEALTPQRINDFVEGCQLDSAASSSNDLDLSGLATAVQILSDVNQPVCAHV